MGRVQIIWGVSFIQSKLLTCMTLNDLISLPDYHFNQWAVVGASGSMWYKLIKRFITH